MKRIVVLSFALAFVVAASGMAMADVIAQWNYNYANDTVIASPAASSGTGTQSNFSTGTVNLNSGVYLPPAGSDPYDANSRVYRLYFTQSTRTGTNPNYVYTNYTSGVAWSVPTTGFENIVVKLDVDRSTTSANSPSNYAWEYSIDGTTWLTGGTFATLSSQDWYGGNGSLTDGRAALTMDLSSITGANNNANFRLRFFENEGSSLYSSSPNTRYLYLDMVTFTGTPVPIPAAAWLLGSGLLGLVAIRRRMKK